MTIHSPSLIELLHRYIAKSRYQDLPESAINSAKSFIYDSVGVGISGSRVANVDTLKTALKASGDFNQTVEKENSATVWVSGEQVSVGTAAMINGYQIHNQEWDCVHEGAVVHPMATILSALTAFAQSQNLSGQQLILGVVVAVDIATLIGDSVNNPLAFFRPSVCGCIGATAGMCAMVNTDIDTIANALGIAYSQISGTMQAHVEGSPMLAMQIGVNARSAITAMTLAQAGFKGPKDILEGPFGYFNLFETDYSKDVIRRKLGKQFQISQVSHKPFPTGRAGHGTIDGLATLQAQHNFTAEQVASIDVAATPLINRLVGRPIKTNMDASYAKLCNGYIAATYLLTGNVSVEDFDYQRLNHKERLVLGKKVSTRLNDCTDANALAPLTVTVTLINGEQLTQHVPAVLGNPNRAMSQRQQDDKFTAACKSALLPATKAQINKLKQAIYALESVDDINNLVNLMIIKP